MNSLIKDIFYGDAGTINNISSTKRESKLREKLENLVLEFKKSLLNEQTEIFDKIINLTELIESETNDVFYVSGFKTGAHLAFECMSDNDI